MHKQFPDFDGVEGTYREAQTIPDEWINHNPFEIQKRLEDQENQKQLEESCNALGQNIISIHRTGNGTLIYTTEDGAEIELEPGSLKDYQREHGNSEIFRETGASIENEGEENSHC